MAVMLAANGSQLPLSREWTDCSQPMEVEDLRGSASLAWLIDTSYERLDPFPYGGTNPWHNSCSRASLGTMLKLDSCWDHLLTPFASFLSSVQLMECIWIFSWMLSLNLAEAITGLSLQEQRRKHPKVPWKLDPGRWGCLTGPGSCRDLATANGQGRDCGKNVGAVGPPSLTHQMFRVWNHQSRHTGF